MKAATHPIASRVSAVIPAVFCLVAIIAILLAANHASAAVSINDSAFSPLGTLKGGDDEAVQSIVGRVINGIIGVSGIIALLMFVYGGVSRMLAQGDSAKVKQSTETMVWAVLGLLIIFSAYAVVNFVLAALSQQ